MNPFATSYNQFLCSFSHLLMLVFEANRCTTAPPTTNNTEHKKRRRCSHRGSSFLCNQFVLDCIKGKPPLQTIECMLYALCVIAADGLESHQKENRETENFRPLAQYFSPADTCCNVSAGRPQEEALRVGGETLRTPKQMKADGLIAPVAQSCYLGC